MARGKVYLVGAGPGDAELMTVKAKRLLEQADVILYDRLLDPAILKGLKAELIDVGKNAGLHKLPQEGINQLLIKKAETGAIVVRLKGGDPYLFGRGGEEALALQEKGIAFEVVPGVTSAIAAPELAGIPVTHRTVASSLIIVTGHEESGKEVPLDWKAIAAQGGTLVVLMGVSRLAANVAALIEAGKPASTPAAMVEKGGWPEQRLISGTLKDIVERVRQAKVESPAILVVGDVVRLAEKLRQRKIAILRPAHQQDESADLAERYGFLPVKAPAMTLLEKPLPSDLLARMETVECVAFTSANGVRMALNIPKVREALTGKIIVAIGPRTEQARVATRLFAACLSKLLQARRGTAENAEGQVPQHPLFKKRPGESLSLPGAIESRPFCGRYCPLRCCALRGQQAGRAHSRGQERGHIFFHQLLYSPLSHGEGYCYGL